MKADDAARTLRDVIAATQDHIRLLRAYRGLSSRSLCKSDRDDLRDGLEISVDKLARVYSEFVCGEELEERGSNG